MTSETGVGGSTTCALLLKELSKLSRFVSGGGIMRAVADQKGMTIEDFAAHNKLHPEDGYDSLCDDMIQSFGRHNFFLAEGRLPHVFVPSAFHVLLVCDLKTRTKRRASSPEFKDIPESEVERIIGQRDADDNGRYQKLYPGCLWAPDDYDIVINTSAHSPETTVSLILEAHKGWFLEKGDRIINKVEIPVEPA